MSVSGRNDPETGLESPLKLRKSRTAAVEALRQKGIRFPKRRTSSPSPQRRCAAELGGAAASPDAETEWTRSPPSEEEPRR